VVSPEDVGAPDHLPAGIVEPPQLTGGAERIDATVSPRRRRPWAIAAHRLAELGGPRIGPQLATCRALVRRAHLLRSTLLDREGAPLRDDERGVAATDRLLPERFQARGRPLGQDGYFIV